METILSNIISILLTALSITIGIRYASVYHIAKKKTLRERYSVIEKNTLRGKHTCKESARLVIEKSSIENAMGFIDVSISDDQNSVILDRYSLINSCLHSVIAPGKIMLKDTAAWKEIAPSNGFASYSLSSKQTNDIPVSKIPSKVVKSGANLKAIETSFSYPESYTGPRYKKRVIVFAKGIGIAYAETEYMNMEKDVYSLRDFKTTNAQDYWFPINTIGNWWVYDVSYHDKPNAINMLCG